MGKSYLHKSISKQGIIARASGRLLSILVKKFSIESIAGALRGGIAKNLRVAGLHDRFQVLCRWDSSSSPAAKPAAADDQGLESSTIDEILKAKGKSADGSWLFCTTEDTVYDAVRSMTNHNVGALLVVKKGEKGAIAGIITERDYLRKIIVQGRSSKTTKVGDIMTEENKLITVTPSTRVLRAMELMTEKRIRHIPVVKDKKMIGMVSIGDVVRAVVDEYREELKRLNSFIQGGY